MVPFDDVWTQMIHLLQPAVPEEIRFTDFIHPSRIRLTGAFFSVLFNLQKFMLFEQRDPNTVKQENNAGNVTCVPCAARAQCVVGWVGGCVCVSVCVRARCLVGVTRRTCPQSVGPVCSDRVRAPRV